MPDFSPQYLQLLKTFEGFFSKPYACPTGHATIGYGTNLEALPRYIPYPDIRQQARDGLRGTALVSALKQRGMVWTKEDATRAMLEELEAVDADLMNRCSAYATLRAKRETVRAEALLDMAYNMGVGRARTATSKGSGLLGFFTFLPRMERGEYAAAAEGLKSSLWYRQVGRRSRAVCQMIQTGAYPEVG